MTAMDKAGIGLAIGITVVAVAFTMAATAPNSVGQTGVQSFGWQKTITHPARDHLGKLMVPSDVSAVKSGAVSLIRKVIVILLEGLFSFDGPSVMGDDSNCQANLTT